MVDWAPREENSLEYERGPLRVQREQPVRAVLLKSLVPKIGGRECLRVFFGDRTLVDQLPLSVVGLGVTQAAERRGHSQCGNSVVAFFHVVGVVRSRWSALR
jgi:hypothetical protein